MWTLLCCFLGLVAAWQPRLSNAQLPGFNAEKAKAVGIRKLTGRWLTLYTDVPSEPLLDELPAVFDAAMPQWEAFFGKAPPADWKCVGSLMKDRRKFEACGLLDARVPNFLNGYTLGPNIWMYEQPTAYYRRHLLLHEGAHAYTLLATGHTGPPWFFEGIAELLGTHRWSDGQLALGVSPPNREAAPAWGRVKIIRDDVAAGRPLTLPTVMGYSNRAHLRNEPYGWCWAATSFLHQHPAYSQAFRSMLSHTALPTQQFNSKFYQQVRKRWPLLQAEWQHYIMSMDYGFDVAREAIDWSPSQPATADAGTFRVDAARGWQSSGIRLTAGATYDVTATGRFQIDTDPMPWISEPNGVTLRYHNTMPVGMLLGAVHDPTAVPNGLSAFCKPQRIGQQATWRCKRDGVLFLRVNESPSKLADNQGSVSVRVRRIANPPAPQ